jgi:hypothetical protein
MPGWQGIPELRHILTGEAMEKPEMLDHDGESEQSE